MIYIRDIGTFFTEKAYDWNQVSSVEINYNYITNFKNGKRTYFTQYILKSSNFSINLYDGLSYINYQDRIDIIKKVDLIRKANDVPLYKNIDVYDENITEFLNDINEN